MLVQLKLAGDWYRAINANDADSNADANRKSNERIH